MYQKVSTDMNFVAREEEIVKFWRENEVFKKTVELRKGAPAFTFFDGPPTANGKPHIGHVETRAIKDIIPRYRTMNGSMPYFSICGLPSRPRIFSTSSSTGRPWVSQPALRSTSKPFIVR